MKKLVTSWIRLHFQTKGAALGRCSGLFILLLLVGCTSQHTSTASSVDCTIEVAPHQTSESNLLRPILQQGKWGFIDRQGKLVIEPKFFTVDDFYESRLTITRRDHRWRFLNDNRVAVGLRNGKWSFIDETGKLITKSGFQQVRSFREERAAVKDKGKWGFINTKGGEIVPAQFSEVGNFFEERAFVKVGEQWGLIDANGKLLVKPKFYRIDVFSKGLAVVDYLQSGYYKTGFVNRNGDVTVEFSNMVAAHSTLQNGLIGVQSREFPLLIKDLIDPGNRVKHAPYGFADRDGKVVIPFQYQFVQRFKDCLAEIKLNNKLGFINTKGEVVIEPKYEDILPFSLLDGLAAVKLNHKFGYVDKTGLFLVEPRFYDARSFSEGLAAIQNHEGDKWGYINTKGDVVIKPQFDTAYEFVDGIARVKVGEGIGYITRTGDYIWKPPELTCSVYTSIDKHNLPTKRWCKTCASQYKGDRQPKIKAIEPLPEIRDEHEPTGNTLTILT